MAKRFQFDKPVERIERLTKGEVEGLLFDLLSAFQIINNPGETALFIQDLLTRSEAKTLAKRLRIAKLLLDGLTYREIEKDIHTSYVTVAKVAGWLKNQGDGFRGVIKKLPKRKNESVSYRNLSDWGKLKRRHPSYFWSELLLEEILKNASKREKKRLRKVIENLDSKSKLDKRVDKLLKYHYSG
jgi:TrpR-related protein YerC/YecD